MKKQFKQSILIVAIVIVSIIQLMFFVYNTFITNKSEGVEVATTSKIQDQKVKFSTINNELKSLDNSFVSDLDNENDRWEIKIILSGNKEQILNSLNKLNDMEKYTINKYNIDGNKGCFTVKLDLNRKK